MRWAVWDWGSAAFNSVATTFVFTVYLTTDGMFTDKATAASHLSLGLTVAGIIIALLAPITGQRADRRGKGGKLLGIFSTGVFICLLLMFFVAPDSPLGSSNALWLGIGLLGLGNIFFEFASVNYNAMLNLISKPKTAGRVSGFGWGLGYVGGIVLLLILFVGFMAPEVGWFGVTKQNGMNTRVSMVIAALWFGLSALPLILNPPKPHMKDLSESHESISTSYKRLWWSVKSLTRNAPQTLWFLIASAVYRDGLAGVFTYGAIIGATVFGIKPSDIIIFAILANVLAGVATILFGYLDDILGPKIVIILSLSVMILSGLGVFVFFDKGPKVFWVLGLLLSIFVGPTQSASRSLLSRMIPEGREGEVFGLYATTGRAVSALAPAMYAVALNVGSMIVGENQPFTHFGILGILLILVVGLIMFVPLRTEKAHLNSLDEFEK